MLLTIAICTKNREPQLIDCVKHAAKSAAFASESVLCDIHVIDDGNLPGIVENSLRDLLMEHAIDLTISRKRVFQNCQPGLYGSRRYAAASSKGDYILFIDDDCNLGETYVSDLASTFHETGAVAVGGVDHRNVPAAMAAWKEFLFSIFLLWGNKNGDLSRTGFNYGHHLWRRQKHIFQSNWLHGCNMAYTRKSLTTLPDCPWLEGHAACEDLVISNHAGKSGKIFVNPNLDFAHLEVPGGRGSVVTRTKKKVLGHWNFLLLREQSVSSKVMFAWSVLGFSVYMIAKKGADARTISRLIGVSR